MSCFGCRIPVFVRKRYESHAGSRGVLLVFALLFMFAGFFATADPAAMDPTLPYLPPEEVHFKDISGKLHWRPYIVRRRSVNGGSGDRSEPHERRFPLQFLVRVATQTGSTGNSRYELHFIGIAGDSPGDSPHFLGTAEYGRDMC